MAAENIQEENWWECHESEEDDNTTSMSEVEGVFERFLEEVDVDVKGHEMIEKLVENGVPFQQVFRQHFRGKHASLMLEEIARKMRGERDEDLVRRERGLEVDGDSLQGGLKNERFKVKTVNVIEEEEVGK